MLDRESVLNEMGDSFSNKCSDQIFMILIENYN